MTENFKFTESNKGTNNELTPILLLHGWGGDLHSLERLQDSLSKELDNQIFNLELPGFGTTEMDDEIMLTKDYAKFVQKFLLAQNIDNAILIGHSYGGKISIESISSKLFNIDKLILINSSGLKPNNSLKKKFSKFLQKITPKMIQESETLKDAYYKYVLRERDYLTAGKLKKSLSKIVEEHYNEFISKIQIPTLLIWGEKDTYTPLWMGQIFEDEIKYSKLVVVPEATHGLPLKQPEICAQIISNWLAGYENLKSDPDIISGLM